jgi:hypothetical protein
MDHTHTLKNYWVQGLLYSPVAGFYERGVMDMTRYFSLLKLLVLVLVAIIAGGCAAIGPRAVVTDRFDYNAAIADSWKTQMLLNIVKIRYGDPPIYLDVASVINSYELSGSTTAGASWTFGPTYGSGASVGALGFFANRPTITYSPMTGERFTRSMMTPIPPSSIFFLVQAGYPVNGVFRALVQSINGIRNRFGGAGRNTPADPSFYTLIEKMHQIQQTGVLEMRVQKTTNKESTLFIIGEKRDEKAEADSQEVRKMLGLDPKARDFTVVYGSTPANDKEIALLTRSVLQLVIDLGSFVDVPDVHVEEKRVLPTLIERRGDGSVVPPLIRIKCGTESPVNAFAAVPYRDKWFWIDDRDILSKGTFSFLLFIFNLVDTGTKEGTPVITIPAR